MQNVGVPINSLLFATNEYMKKCHVASKYNFYRFSRRGGFEFDVSKEMKFENGVRDTYERIENFHVDSSK